MYKILLYEGSLFHLNTSGMCKPFAICVHSLLNDVISELLARIAANHLEDKEISAC